MPRNKLVATAKRILRRSPKSSKKSSANMATESSSFESNTATATKDQLDESYPAASQTENDHVHGSSQSVAGNRNSSGSDLSEPPESPVQNYLDSSGDQTTETIAEHEQLSATTIPDLTQPSPITTPAAAKTDALTTTDIALNSQPDKYNDGKSVFINGASEETLQIAPITSNTSQPSKPTTANAAQHFTSTILGAAVVSTSSTPEEPQLSTSNTSDAAHPPPTIPEEVRPEPPVDTNGTPEELESLDDGDDELSEDDDDNEDQPDQASGGEDEDEVDLMINAYVEGKTQSYDFEQYEPTTNLETPASEEVATPAEYVATPAEDPASPAEDGDVPAEEDATTNGVTEQEATPDETIAGNGTPTVDEIADAENVLSEFATPRNADADVSRTGTLAAAPGTSTDKSTTDDDGATSLNTPELQESGDTPTDDEMPADPSANDETDELLAAQLANDEERADIFDEVNLASFTRRDKKTYSFKKLTDVEEFKSYLANPQDISYGKLYNRTATVANIMKQYQDEYDLIQKELNDYESAKKAKAKEAEEEAKVVREKAQKEEDVKLLKLLAKYPEIQGMKLVPWKAFQEKFTTHNGEKMADWALPLLSKLKSAPHNAALLKRKEAYALPAPKQRFLVDAPYKGPTKSEQKAWDKEKADEEKLKRKILIDPVVFEDKKMADVYGFLYSDKPEHIGNQPLAVRNDAESTRTGARETRARNTKRKKYETDDGTPAVSEEEQLPPKRARKPRNLDDGSGSPAGPRSRTGPRSRNGTPNPAPRLFASGARVGRPPGSKSKTKLKASIIASGEEEPKEEEIQANGLPAEALVTEDNVTKNSINGEENDEVAAPVAEEEVPAPQTKKKHAGGRPRGGAKKTKSEPTVDEDVIALEPLFKAEPEIKPKPKPNGRGKKKRALTEDPEDNVLPSTEKDDSGSGSRPTSSSSANTTSTARRPTRSTTRGISAAPKFEEDPIPRTKKRKRGNNSTIKVVPPIEEEEEMLVLAPAPKKRKAAAAKNAPPPAVAGPVPAPNSRKRKATAAPPQVSSESDAPLVPPPPNSRKRKATQASSESVTVGEEAPAPAPPPKRARTTQTKKSKAKASSGEESDFNEATTQPKRGGRSRAAAKGSSAEESEFKETTVEAEEKDENEEVEEIEVPKRKMAPRAITKRTPATKAPPPPSRKSARERKPTGRAMGLDGADDDSDEEMDSGSQQQRFKSEYDRFQALTSPGGSMSLGKRVRKTRLDPSSFVEPGSEDDEFEFTN